MVERVNISKNNLEMCYLESLIQQNGQNYPPPLYPTSLPLPPLA